MLKIITIVLLVGFFLIAAYSSHPSRIINTGIEITDPFMKSITYNENLEIVDNKTVILSTSGYKVLAHGGIPYSPFLEHDLRDYHIRPTDNLLEVKNDINMLIHNDYDILIFKQVRSIEENLFFDVLADSDQFLIKEHSNTFCKIEYFEDEFISYEACMMEPRRTSPITSRISDHPSICFAYSMSSNTSEIVMPYLNTWCTKSPT